MDNMIICEQFPLFDLTDASTLPQVCFTDYHGALNIHVGELPPFPDGTKVLHLGAAKLTSLECGTKQLHVGDLLLAEYGKRTTTMKANHLKGVGVGLINFLRDIRETHLDTDF